MGIVVGLVVSYFYHKHLDTLYFDNQSSTEQVYKLQPFEVLSTFKQQNFISHSPEEGTDQCPISKNN